jgi:nitrogen fixation/metabolism regulation signal transduction histidine kinase
MSFRRRLFLLSTLAVAATAVLASWAISESVTAAFERLEGERTDALTRQIQRELEFRSREVVRRLDALAASDTVRAMTADLARPEGDTALFVNEAPPLAKLQNLDLLEIVSRDGSIISSAHYPARFGYRKEWVTEPVDWHAAGAFVEMEQLPEETAVALLAVRPVGGLFLVGGQRIDREMLDSLALPASMQARLYRETGRALTGGALSGSVRYATGFAEIAEQVRRSGKVSSISMGGRFDEPRTLFGIPLSGRSRQLLAVLMVEARHAELFWLRWFIRGVAMLGAVAGITLGFGIAWWATARLTRPVRALVEGADRVSAGDWNARVPVEGEDDMGRLARSFNHMTAQLAQQRERLVQVERVAAWRQLARRLAHELKNPLFPLQITVENLQRARAAGGDSAAFDEVFRESTRTLIAEIGQLNGIIARFSDFARMPAPRFEPVALAEFLPGVLRLFDAQLTAPGRPPVRTTLDVEPGLAVEADPEQLSRALRNLVLNAMDAMPDGGTIGVKAARNGASVVLEVTDTGTGLTEEECVRLFTPYYTTRKHGTGLGLAIVQSVVSDHGGTISVSSRPGEGSRFRIELPETRNPHGESAAG